MPYKQTQLLYCKNSVAADNETHVFREVLSFLKKPHLQSKICIHKMQEYQKNFKKSGKIRLIEKH